MPKSAAEFEEEFLASLKSKSGADLKTWMTRCQKSGETKHNAMLKFLKTEHGFNHMQGNFLAAIFMNGGKPVYSDASGLLEQHFAGKASQRPIFEVLEKKIKKLSTSVEIVPTKGYISFRNFREFAVAKVTKTSLRVGLDLGEEPFEGLIQKANSLGTMPRISHMFEVFDSKGINADLVKCLKTANRRVNGL